MAAIETSGERMKQALAESGWVEEDILAVGHLRQGKKPSMGAMLVGTALIEVIRPRRSKKLPRHFVLALTPTRTLAFKASLIGSDRPSPNDLRIHEGVVATFAPNLIVASGLEDGPQSESAVLTVEGESFPVWRPLTPGDPNTDELLARLAG